MSTFCFDVLHVNRLGNVIGGRGGRRQRAAGGGGMEHARANGGGENFLWCQWIRSKGGPKSLVVYRLNRTLYFLIEPALCSQ